MDGDGGNVRQLTSGTADDRHAAWSPDGKLLAVDSGSSTRREIWTVDVSSGARKQITSLVGVASFPSWSPDGARVAFYVYRAGTMDVWIVGANGDGAAAMTRGLASEARLQCTFACHSAAWSPDGARIAIADGDQRRVLLMASVIDSALRPITPDGENDHFPRYLANGSVIYVSEHIALDQSWTDLWSTDPAASDTRTAVAQNVLAQGPFEISADGKQLLFASPRSGNFEIYAVTLDDAGSAALATAADQLGAPEVIAPKTGAASSNGSPDGSLVAYAGAPRERLVGPLGLHRTSDRGGGRSWGSRGWTRSAVRVPPAAISPSSAFAASPASGRVVTTSRASFTTAAAAARSSGAITRTSKCSGRSSSGRRRTRIRNPARAVLRSQRW